MNSKAQIIATIGPSSIDISVLSKMIEHQMDVARLNCAWGDIEEHARYVKTIREAEKKSGRKIIILLDLPGPRIQNGDTHSYETGVSSVLTDEDVGYITFGIEHGVDYFAQSFVGDEKDILKCKEVVSKKGGTQPVIAKIERIKAVENLTSIIGASDAIMVARGDLGSEVPLEQIPFIQEKIVRETKKSGKPVIVATQMLFSMVENLIPTRADVTDVANAIIQGADVVMLSEETAKGKYPVEAVTMMERIVLEAEKHLGDQRNFNLL